MISILLVINTLKHLMLLKIVGFVAVKPNFSSIEIFPRQVINGNFDFWRKLSTR